MPICIDCKHDKPEGEFRYRPERRWRLKHCRPCERAIQIRNYYRAKDRDELGWRVGVMRNNRSRHITREWLIETFEKQGGQCALSGRPIDLLTCEVDHIQPKTRSGTDELRNLRLVCTRANEAKGNMTDAEFLELCVDVLRNSSGRQS